MSRTAQSQHAPARNAGAGAEASHAGTTRRRRGGALLAAMVAVVALAGHGILEIVLRHNHFVYYFERGYEPGDFPDSAYVILTLGDSSTYGYGVADPYAMSYPAQLERLLRARAPQQDFRVIKQGFPGANSSQLARRLEGFLELYKPDMLILLTGNNEVWNLKESRLPLFAENASWLDRLHVRATMLLDQIRVARLYRRLWVALHDKRDKHLKAMKDIEATPASYEYGERLLGRPENVASLLAHNIGEMLDRAHAQGADTMVLEYNVPSYLHESDYLRPLMKQLREPLVDLEPLFNEAKAKGLPVIEANDDWHANELGYAIFCRAIFNELVRRGIVQAPPFEKIVDDTLAPIP